VAGPCGKQKISAARKKTPAGLLGEKQEAGTESSLALTNRGRQLFMTVGDYSGQWSDKTSKCTSLQSVFITLREFSSSKAASQQSTIST